MPSETKDVGSIHDDILIAKMRPGILFLSKIIFSVKLRIIEKDKM